MANNTFIKRNRLKYQHTIIALKPKKDAVIDV